MTERKQMDVVRASELFAGMGRSVADPADQYRG
jgi:hypothetical protein